MTYIFFSFQVIDETMFKVQVVGHKEIPVIGSVGVVELIAYSSEVSLNQLLRHKKQTEEKEINNNTNKLSEFLLFFLITMGG